MKTGTRAEGEGDPLVMRPFQISVSVMDITKYGCLVSDPQTGVAAGNPLCLNLGAV
jgi:hypothetical protein